MQDLKRPPLPRRLLRRVRQFAQRARRQITGVRVLGVLMIVLMVGTAVQGIVQNRATEQQARATEQQARAAEEQSRATERIAACVKSYSDGFADALDARSAVSAAATDALDEFFFAIAAAPEQARQRFDDYIAKRKAAKATQAANPYPAPPRDVCR